MEEVICQETWQIMSYLQCYIAKAFAVLHMIK